MKYVRAGLAVAIACWFFVGASWAGEKVRHPLSPPDTSSPKATLTSFLENSRAAYKLGSEVRASFLASGRSRLTRDEISLVKLAYAHIARAIRCLDLSKIPKAFLSRQAPEAAILLKEVLDRVGVPPLEDRPTAKTKDGKDLQKWRIPNTDIAIYRVSSGPNAGEYLFSPGTVRRIQTFYNAVRHLPYQETTTKGWYERYIGNPKGLAVVTSVLPLRWVVDPPGWAKQRVFGQAVWQWLGLAIAVVLSIAIIFSVHRIGRYWQSRHPDSPLGGLWIRAVELSAAIAILRGLEFVSGGMLGITVGFHNALFILLWLVPIVLVAWLAWVVSSAVAETIIAFQHPRARGISAIDSQLLRLAFRLMAVIAVSAVLVAGANLLGLPAYSILTGLGVGGFAIALAARETLANLFGSLVIMFEKPFSIGDWIRVGDDEGFVESVGFRSTRIRTFYDSLISIPSGKLVDATVDNLGAREYRRIKTTLAVTYDTSPQQLQAFVNGIKGIILSHSKTRKDKLFVVFKDFGSHSLDILVYFFLKVPDRSVELIERQTIFLQIMQLAEDMNVKFAFPTETLHVESFPASLSTPTAQQVAMVTPGGGRQSAA